MARRVSSAQARAALRRAQVKQKQAVRKANQAINSGEQFTDVELQSGEAVDLIFELNPEWLVDRLWPMVDVDGLVDECIEDDNFLETNVVPC